MTPVAGGGWTEAILYSFSGTDGAVPGDLILDTAGNLYGVTDMGGTYDGGVAFEMSSASGGGWTESTIYSFEGSSDGAVPGALTFEGPNLYGVTVEGGAGGYGTVFELEHQSNGDWTHDVLYSFKGRKDGRYPGFPLVFDRSGNLYGSGGEDVSCIHGDRWGCGNVFELMPGSGGKWELHVLHTFTGGSHGSSPSNPVFNRDGNLVGVTEGGGDLKCSGGGGYGCGMVFDVVP